MARRPMIPMADVAVAAAVGRRQIYDPAVTAAGDCLFTALKNDGLSAHRQTDSRRA